MKTPLYIQSNYSLLSSLIEIDDMIALAKNKGWTSLALTDNQMYGTLLFYQKCVDNEIKPVIGLEITLESDLVLLYAKDYSGYQNLIQLSTIQSERVVTLEEVSTRLEHIIVVVPYSSFQTFQLLKEKTVDIYLGCRNQQEEELAALHTKNLVFIQKTLYLEKKDAEYLPYLWMIRDGKIEQDISSFDVLEYGISENPSNIGDELLFNVDKILAECHLKFPEKTSLLPIYPVENPSEYLVHLSKKGLSKRLGGEVSEVYASRLMYELSVIQKMGFANYFLVVCDYIRYAKQNKILVGPGRGSAVGSLVAYSLGITDIDPIQYDLLFERFLNPERVTMPDIDTDFPDIYRDQVINYVKEKYGEKRVCGIVTFGTLAAKLAIRDVSRVLNIPLYQVDTLTKKIPNITKLKLRDFYEQDAEIKTIIDGDRRLQKMYKIASRIEGFPRHTSSHASGIVMSLVDLNEVIPLTRHDDMYLTGYSMEYLEDLGLLKMDFLGLKNLTTIMRVLEDIKTGEGIEIDFSKIPLDDPEALRLFQTADTTGIFQFESSGMRNFLRNLHPNSFEDIFAAIALFRPGPASNIDTFIRRKEGKEKVTYLDPSLEPILKNTYGIIVYQEQIMQVSQVFAGYTLGEADILRRAMSKKKYDVLKQEEARFLERSQALGRDYKTAKEVFELILKFANYGFNRSHSVAYSIIAFKMAYLKVRYPKYFYANLLSSVIGVESKTREYILEIKGKGIPILKPDVNFSYDIYTVEKDGIRFPLSNIKNIGTVACKDILASRAEGFSDIYDFLKNTTPRIINKKVLESLIDSDCFSSFGYNHKTLYTNLDVIMNYANLTKELDEEFVLKPEIEVVEEFDKDILIAKEKELFGFYISNHPVTEYKIRENIQIPLTEIQNLFGQKVTIIAMVDRVKKIMTKRGEEMAFVYLSDEYTSLDLTLFPRTLQNYPNIRVGDILKITGSIERRYNTFQMVGEKLEKLN